MNGTSALLLLFVVLPVVLGVVVIALVGRGGPTVAPELRTSSLLQDGEPAKAELLQWKRSGALFLDRRPMVAFRVRVVGESTELTIVQSIPAGLVRDLEKGMTLDVRLSPDRSAGAVDLASFG